MPWLATKKASPTWIITCWRKTLPPARRAVSYTHLDVYKRQRYITPRMLSCLLQEKENDADYCTMAARMALCVEQTRQTVAALDIRRCLLYTSRPY